MKALNLIIVTLLILVSNNLFSQKRPPQDIRRVVVTNRYILKDGKYAGEGTTVYQEIYDSLGRLHTEIEYDYKDKYPHIYKWHTYSGKNLIKSQLFQDGKLRMIKEFVYTSDSLLTQEIIKTVKPQDTSVFMVLTYKYNIINKPIQIEAKTSLGKTAYKTKSEFDSKGTEIFRTVKTKRGYCPLDSIIKMTCKPNYDSLGQLSSNLISITKLNKSIIINDYKYSYSIKGNLTGIKILDKNGKQISREERIYQENRNRISQIKLFDSNDNLSIWLGKRYELYKDKIRRERVIDY